MMIRHTSLLLSLALTATATAQGFGAIYTLTNATAGNAVNVNLRLPNGVLLPFASFDTTGTGTGTGLGSQGALALSANDKFLYAVDAGSDQVTMFHVLFGIFLLRADTEATGDQPTSVATHGNLVYVLNAGDDTVRGFRRTGNHLQPIVGASYPLSQPAAAGAQVGFSPDGKHLVVTERATNTIDVFAVNGNGTLGAVTFNASAGNTPFGFSFREDGTLVVSEAVGGMADASVTSSYRIQTDGTLLTISGAVPTDETAACWVAIPSQGHYAYTTNTGSGTITGYELDGAGQLTRLDANGVTGDLDSTARPIDFEFSPNGRYLFVLDSGNDRIRTFSRRPDGSLALQATSIDVVDGTAGMIVR
ncbi:MAG: beta-propeller fold lactonase family protein [Planctomycetes bacterium]|nr:beta-propeller fold lactonase family protein [Planctomycetota bacterium]